jgi:tripartite-type tricarboxylate transporter receptor subunit TctC
MRFTHIMTAAAALCGMFAAGPASADAIADFYKGKRIQLLVGSGPGGGYDVYARMLSRHMGRHIPGNPGFLVKNMEGAGSIVMANYVFNVAPKDGSVIAGMQRNAAMAELMGQKGPKFKSVELNWLGSLADEPGACAIATRTNVKSFEEVFTRTFIMGGTGPNDTEINPALINNALGGKFRLIKGYPSTPPIHLAIERGEVDGICQSWASLSDQGGPMIRAGTLKPIIQLTIKPVPELSKMGVPTIFDVIKTGKHLGAGVTQEEASAYFQILMGVRVMGRPFAMAAKVPADRVKAMRVAFDATAKDAQFQAEAKKLKRDVDLITGDEIQKIVAEMAAQPKSALAKLDDMLKFKGPTQTAKVEQPKFSGKISKVIEGGRKIALSVGGKDVQTGISGSRTKITVAGKAANRSAFKEGMECNVTLPNEGAKEAANVDCK